MAHPAWTEWAVTVFHVPDKLCIMLGGKCCRDEQACGVGLKQLLDGARDVSAALEFLHARAILHRDLKPANVILMSDGSFKVGSRDAQVLGNGG